MRNLLVFHLENSWGDDEIIIANNEKDLEDYLINKEYKSIEFRDLDASYGTCSVKDQYGNRETAKCFYAKYI